MKSKEHDIIKTLKSACKIIWAIDFLKHSGNTALIREMIQRAHVRINEAREELIKIDSTFSSD